MSSEIIFDGKKIDEFLILGFFSPEQISVKSSFLKNLSSSIPGLWTILFHKTHISLKWLFVVKIKLAQSFFEEYAAHGRYFLNKKYKDSP